MERRRTIRIRRSSLLEAKLQDVDRPSIKIAETLDEYLQAFRLVHDEYLAQGYIKAPNASRMQYGVHDLLPRTCLFIFKSYLDVISTLTFIPDHGLFGLPMDALFKTEVDTLREQGRKVVELSALATDKRKRWRNIILIVTKAMFHYAKYTGVDDLCIMVNPKHVRFYKNIFLFKDFGGERFYEKVGAPAVGLRVDFSRIEDNLFAAYGEEEFDTDLHGFFLKTNRDPLEPDLPRYQGERRQPLDYSIARYLLANKPGLLCGLGSQQRDYMENLYHKALYAPSQVAMGECRQQMR
jgi:hypothetical protein